MRFSDPIQLRLEPQKRNELEAIAASRGIPLSELIRERLDQMATTLASITSLRLALAVDEKRAPQPEKPPEAFPVEIEAMLAEILLTLRETTPDAKRRYVQLQLRQMSLPTWSDAPRRR